MPAHQPSAFDIPGMPCLAEVARTLGVTITLRGGVVRRAFMNPGAPDLFALARFGSDIDLVHTATPELNGAVAEAIYDQVPYAECFRWEIRSAPEEEPFAQAAPYSPVMPVLQISASTDGVIYDPFGGLAEIASKYYTYQRNPRYSQSPLYRAARDLELFSALLYLRAVIEAGATVPERSAQAISDVIGEARTWPIMTLLRDSVYLRMRLRYLVKGLAAAMTGPDRAEVGDDVVAPLRELLYDIDRVCGYSVDRNSLSYDNELSGSGRHTVVSSSHLRGESFRLQEFAVDWCKAGEEQAQLNSLFKVIDQNRINAETPLSRLGPNQSVALASYRMPLEQGVARSSQLSTTVRAEFAYFLVWLPEGAVQVAEEDLAVVLALFPSHDETEVPVFFSPPSCCRVHQKRLELGINFGGLLALEHAGRPRFQALQVFVLQWNGAER